MTTFDLFEPRSVEEATTLLAQHRERAKVIAGGTAVVIMLKNRLIAPQALISLGSLDGLRTVEAAEDGGLRIGALVTLHEVERAPLVRQRFPTLAATCHQVGNVRVRHAATVGGNLCEADYASDPPALLVGARGRVRLVSAHGEREVPLTAFFAGFYETATRPDELLVELRIPPLPPTTRTAYLKFTTRSSEDRPCIGVAAFVDVDDAGICRELRVVVGAVAETPQEVPAAEALATGQRLTPELIRAVAEGYAAAIEPLADLRGSAWYRTHMIRVFVRDAILEALGDSR